MLHGCMLGKFAVRMRGERLARESAVARHDASALLAASDVDTDRALEQLGSSGNGLLPQQVSERLTEYGPNQIAHEQPVRWYGLLLHTLHNPFVLVLGVLGAVSFWTGDGRAALVVSVMVAVSVLMRFVQEFRSSREAEALRAMVQTFATVMRQSSALEPDAPSAWRCEQREVPFEELVPGDIVHLSAGDMVPADLRILKSKDLFVTQSVLTGEALPVEKYDAPGGLPGKEPHHPGRADLNPLERGNLCFMGTNVISGSALGLVVATGRRTYFGALARGVIGHRNLTSFDHGVNSVTRVLIAFMLVMVPVVLLINGFLKGDWREAFLFATAIAVGLTPEMLPMVVTANLARGAVGMARRKVVVKRLNAIQNFGAMDVLCTDKTGTLTEDRIVLEEHLDIRGVGDSRVLDYAYLNSRFQTGLKNLLDRAVLERVPSERQRVLGTRYQKVDEIPFDFARRRMSVVVWTERSHDLLICKGATEEVLEICAYAEERGVVIPLTDDLRSECAELVAKKNESGLRVVAVAYKKMRLSGRAYTIADESDLVLLGFVAFLDPPKASAAAALAALRDHGVAVKILTGDNETVTRRVCREVGLDVARLVLGSEIDALSERELAELCDRVSVFAKLAPLQKARIVRALRNRGHTVGFLGDGINDAAALRDADVGISVDSATDIARESADLILLEKSLLVLEEGVLRGRQVYGNIIKYIKMTASSNFGNVFSVLIASAFLPFLPMLPIQLLIQNLLYDFSQLSLPWDRMDREFLEQPRKWEPSGIARFMVFVGPVSSVFDVLTFLVLWWALGANSPERQALFQSGWFVEGLLSQTLIVHMIRTQRIPFLQSVAAPPVLLLTGLIMALGIWLPFSSIAGASGLVRLPGAYFLWLGGILLSYFLLTQGVKTWYIRRFRSWL
ncbi:MAG TPA: magnesium-translocating P-type ATPase [Myxococcota bacterium]|nr:magnesium-translocating P-type ATPase [Myxococcota bacterium]